MGGRMRPEYAKLGASNAILPLLTLLPSQNYPKALLALI
jgi:hypothetical protein